MPAPACDLLILGGGPGGAAAAITAARAGLHVVLMERSPFPRYRPGETLHPGIEPVLERLGVRDAVLDAGYLRHTGIWVGWDTPVCFTPYGADARGPWQGFQAIRADFDTRLLTGAMRAGAQVCQDSAAQTLLSAAGRVTGVQTAHGPWRARCVVDAMGARHTLARWFGVPMRRYSPTLVVRYGYVAGECPDRDQAPCLQADAQGWTWTARVAPRLYQWTRLLVNDTRLPRDWRPAELQGLTPQGHTRGADVTWRIAARTAGPGFFLVGDAAAVLDPASSHGVLRAMMSGIMAAHLATLAIKQPQREPEVSAAYHAWLSDWFAHDVGMLKAAYMRAGMLCGG